MCHMSFPAQTHGESEQTSTTAPRYLSVELKADAAVEVVTVVAMEFERSIRNRAGRWQDDGVHGSAT